MAWRRPARAVSEPVKADLVVAGEDLRRRATWGRDCQRLGRSSYVRSADLTAFDASAHWLRTMVFGRRGDVWTSAHDLRVRCEPAVSCALRGRPLHHGGLLVHGINVICESSGDNRPARFRTLSRELHLRASSPSSRRSFSACSPPLRCIHGFGPITNRRLLREARELECEDQR